MARFYIKRWNLGAIIGVLAIVAAIFALLSTNALLKRPFGEEADLGGLLTQLDTLMNSSSPDWAAIREMAALAESAWSGVSNRLQFNGEKDDILRFSRSIHMLLGAIDIQDRSEAKSQISLLRSIWKDL